MIALARDAPRVLFDSSPLISLGQAGLLFPCARYVGARAAIVRDVHNELVRNRDRFPDLRALSMLRWPPGEPLDVPPDLIADVEAIRRLNTEPGAHPDKNRGEVATALLAGRLRNALAVMDDVLGKRLCQMRAVPRLSTALLIAELVAAGAVGEREGAAGFERSTPSGVGRAEFDHAVARATAALGVS